MTNSVVLSKKSSSVDIKLFVSFILKRTLLFSYIVLSIVKNGIDNPFTIMLTMIVLTFLWLSSLSYLFRHSKKYLVVESAMLIPIILCTFISSIFLIYSLIVPIVMSIVHLSLYIFDVVYIENENKRNILSTNS